jgi:DNA topoisomerase-1
MKQTLIIVESPTKAKTISKFLGKEYIVRASMGHIRDLPDKAESIPAKYKKEKWARLGINIADNFAPLYVVNSDKKKIVKELKEIIADAADVILAPDEDREGEAIAWHLSEVLDLPKNSKRIVFHEITQSAIDHALENPRTIDMQVVQAQETRRILDRLVGYGLSPLLWKKIKFGLSAGRVQSVAVKLIVEREFERLNFKKASYMSVQGAFFADKSEKFTSTLFQIDSRNIAVGKDFSDKGVIIDPSKVYEINSKNVESILEDLRSKSYAVDSVEQTEMKRNPQAPYITSSLQIDANRKLGMSSKQTMQVAQKLYEQGFITYMRTDSVNLSLEALNGIKSKILKTYGYDYYAGFQRKFSSKSKNAQEAHEAIRPAGSDFKTAVELGLDGDQYRLYDMIWKRTIACQMKEAILDQTTIFISSDNSKYLFKSTGNVIKFDGFLKAYNIDTVENSENGESEDSENQNLPALKADQKLNADKFSSSSHETKPPARYNEASLVKKLEQEGIGRPSTYASIISTIQARGYIKKFGQQLAPTFSGIAVNNLLEKYFASLVDVKFTAQMEDSLDEIESGEIKWLPYMTDFYLGDRGLENKIKISDPEIDPKAISTIYLPGIKESNPIRFGKFGAYVDFGDVKATIPDSLDIADITQEYLDSLSTTKSQESAAICIDDNGNPVYFKTGRYGPYLEVMDGYEPAKKTRKKTADTSSDNVEQKVKLKFVSVPPEYKDNLTEDLAKKLIGLPRILGQDSEGTTIQANFGRYGPYVEKVLEKKVYASIPKDNNIFDITLDEALKLFTEKKPFAGRRFSGRRKSFGKK